MEASPHFNAEQAAAAEAELYDRARAGILHAIDSGTYDPELSQRVIAEATGVGIINVRQMAFGMVARGEIGFEPSPDGGHSRQVLTETGELRLADFRSKLNGAHGN